MIELYRQGEMSYSLFQNNHSERLDYWEFRNLIYFLKAQFDWSFDEYLYEEQPGYIFHTEDWKLRNAILSYLYDNVTYLNRNYAGSAY